jgi:hypothetical protein
MGIKKYNYCPNNPPSTVVNYVDENNMMLHKDITPLPDSNDGKGDALWRTSIAYIIYKRKELIGGITSCFKGITTEDNEYIQVYRYPEEGFEKTTSRDQIAAALIALCEVNTVDNLVSLHYLTQNLKWRISEKYTQTIDFNIWLEALKNMLQKKMFWVNIYYILSIMMIIPIIFWNKFFRLIGNFKSKSQENFRSFPTKSLSLHRRIAAKVLYPTYAFFLWCWQIRVLPDNWYKFYLQKLMLIECEKSNYVLRILLGEDASKFETEFENYKSMRGLRWNARLDDSTNDGMRICTDKEILCNDIDKDLFKYLIQK